MLHLTDIFFISVGAFSVRPSLVHPTCDERNEQCVYVSTGIMLLTRVLCTRDLQILNGTGDVLVPMDTYVLSEPGKHSWHFYTFDVELLVRPRLRFEKTH